MTTFLAGAVQTAAAAVGHEQLEKRVHKNASGETLPYRLFVPKDYDKSKPYALILFLHGAGERGDDNEAQLKHDQFLRFADPAVQAKQRAIIVAPQCPSANLDDGSDQHKWVQLDWGRKTPIASPKEPSYSLRLTFEILDSLEKEFNIDASRRYVTGLSMGGYGTFDALMRRPDYWAAGVPICGGMDNSRAKTIAHIPLWVFHGDKDTAVPVERSRTAVAALKAAGGEPKYTEYAGQGHFVWGLAYEEPELVDWLYAQQRK
ncbi:MAG: prolyl oligopeptidase family serine peptidase [Planctomycetales bacterium]|nr:prolyl oligopeptidase family serine peptidase [Planctomycetales bacterium]